MSPVPADEAASPAFTSVASLASAEAAATAEEVDGKLFADWCNFPDDAA